MSQSLLLNQDLSAFIQPGRVHRQIYTDPAIFELELERIFGVAWIYIGHESQVKNPGDYFRSFIGRKPVVLVRDADGAIRVIHNQCAHRGSMVVANDKGNASEFQCCYHGWTYHLDGRLKRIPLQHGYPENFDPNNPKTAMTPMARVKSYRGFVFASEAEDGPGLKDFLGHMTTSLDDMIDRAPDGEVEISGGVFRHAYDANWKLYLENLCDAAHPIFTHRSSIDAALAQPDDVYSDGSGEIAIRQMRQNGAPYSFWESRSASGPIRTATPISATITTTPSWSRRCKIRCSATTSRRWRRRKARRRRVACWKCGAGTAMSIQTSPS
jgi:phenylpropionate dioxygenase-like ring-hydroxylating dioxygenase large terminal subunit